MSNLERLSITLSGLKKIPESIESLTKLKELDLSHNYNIKELPITFFRILWHILSKLSGSKLLRS